MKLNYRARQETIDGAPKVVFDLLDEVGGCIPAVAVSDASGVYLRAHNGVPYWVDAFGVDTLIDMLRNAQHVSRQEAQHQPTTRIGTGK